MGEQRTFGSLVWSQKGEVTRREPFVAGESLSGPPPLASGAGEVLSRDSRTPNAARGGSGAGGGNE
jgi:hypothetical protein